MPELPEVETIVRDLRPELIGKTIEGVALSWPGVIAGLEPAEFVRRVTGRRIEDVDRRGKNILIRLSGGEVLLIHLRMSGRLTVVPAGEEEQRFQRAALRLDGGEELRLADLRKFGRLQLLPAADLARLEARLGPEPLGAGFTPEAFHRLLGGRRARLKALLLDQSFLAGIGNIYADEALFVAGLHPHRLAATLSDEEARRLYVAVQDVLRQSIANRGTTFSDYRDGRGQPGGHQRQLNVYRRTGEPCYRCGTPVERLPFGGRGTHYCPKCQPIDGAPPPSNP